MTFSTAMTLARSRHKRLLPQRSDLTVGKAAEEAGASIVGFVRMEVGEGIEKKEEDFAAEVAKAAQG